MLQEKKHKTKDHKRKRQTSSSDRYPFCLLSKLYAPVALCPGEHAWHQLSIRAQCSDSEDGQCDGKQRSRHHSGSEDSLIIRSQPRSLSGVLQEADGLTHPWQGNQLHMSAYFLYPLWHLQQGQSFAQQYLIVIDCTSLNVQMHGFAELSICMQLRCHSPLHVLPSPSLCQLCRCHIWGASLPFYCLQSMATLEVGYITSLSKLQGDMLVYIVHVCCKANPPSMQEVLQLLCLT